MDQPYQLLPPLSPEDLDRLRESIRERGIEVPIIVDEDGNIIDGHNRKRIADELGVPCRQEVRSGLADHEKRILAAELNSARRQLTDAQKVELGRQIEPDIAERAKLRQIALAGKRKQTSVTTVAKVEDPKRTTDEVAKTVGIGSGRTYERGKQTIARAEKAMGAEKVKQQVATGSTVRDIAKQTERVEREQEQAQTRPVNDTEKALATALFKSTLPALVSQRILRSFASARVAKDELDKMDLGVLQSVTAENDEVRDLMLEGIDVAGQLASVCRRALGARGAHLREVI